MNNIFKAVQIEKFGCKKCTLNNNNKKQCLAKTKDSVQKKVGKGNTLIITEWFYDRTLIYNLEIFLRTNGISDYTLLNGIDCQLNNLFDKKGDKLPLTSIYSNCNTISAVNLNDFDAIITVGQALYSVTQTDDIPDWKEFNEYLFNPTFFYTGFKTDKKIRVYPLPPLDEFIDRDNFQNFYAKKQIEFIKDYFADRDEYAFLDSIANEPYDIKVLKNPNRLLKKLNNESEKRITAVDTETNSLNHFEDNFRIGCVTLCNDGRTGYYLPFDAIEKNLLSDYFTKIKQLYHNAKYDCKAFERKGVKNAVASEDSAILAHVLNTERKKVSLKTLAWQVGFGNYDAALDDYKRKFKPKTYLDIPENILSEYAALDTVVTYRVYKALMKIGEKQPDIIRGYYDYLIPVIPVFQEAEIKGIEIDLEKFENLNTKLLRREKVLAKKIQDSFGLDFDVNSNDQLAQVLEYEGWPEIERTKKKLYKTGVDELNYWKKQGYDQAQLILDYRAIQKLRTSFVGSLDNDNEENEPKEFTFEIEKKVKRKRIKEKGLSQYIQSDNCIHSDFNIGRTNSIRSSCHNPNLQQIPSHGEPAKLLRPVFKCAEDEYFVEIDYDSFQINIMAEYSKDKTMIENINKGIDFHSVTATNIFQKEMSLEEFIKVKGKDPYKTARFKSKGVNFSLLFSNNAGVLIPVLKNDWSDEEIDKYISENKLEIKSNSRGQEDKLMTVASDIREIFFRTYPNILKFIHKQHKLVKKQGYVESPFGFRRHLPELTYIGKDTEEKTVRSQSNMSVNSPVQTFEVCVVMQAMTKIYNFFKENNMKSSIRAMTHDSLMFIVKKDELKMFYENVIPLMEDTKTYKVPLTVEAEISKTWKINAVELNNKSIGEFA